MDFRILFAENPMTKLKHGRIDRETLNGYLANPQIFDGMDSQEVLSLAISCAMQAGSMIRAAISDRNCRGSACADTKISAADLVTETDIAVEKEIRKWISSAYPNHLFVGEEGTGAPIPISDRANKYVWIVDPIDGTTNFVHTFPVIAVSIAFARGDDLLMGVVYNPLSDELWFAWKGCGARMIHSNGQIVAIHTSGCSTLSSALVSTGFGVPLFRRKLPNPEAQQRLRSIVEHNTWVLMNGARDLRRIGSAACDICYVAMGRTDSFFEFGVKEWDIAAGLVILHEAGGSSSTVGGLKPYSIRGRNVLVAASDDLRAELSKALTDKDVVSIIHDIEK
jgi:myo-inositol-1(or 4)-monophosphatase